MIEELKMTWMIKNIIGFIELCMSKISNIRSSWLDAHRIQKTWNFDFHQLKQLCLTIWVEFVLHTKTINNFIKPLLVTRKKLDLMSAILHVHINHQKGLCIIFIVFIIFALLYGGCDEIKVDFFRLTWKLPILFLILLCSAICCRPPDDRFFIFYLFLVFLPHCRLEMAVCLSCFLWYLLVFPSFVVDIFASP